MAWIASKLASASLIPDRDTPGPAQGTGDEGIGIVGLRPRRHLYVAPVHSGRLEERNDQHGMPDVHDDQNSRPLRIHRLVTGEVREVGADGEDDRIHPVGGHDLL